MIDRREREVRCLLVQQLLQSVLREGGQFALSKPGDAMNRNAPSLVSTRDCVYSFWLTSRPWPNWSSTRL